MDSRGLTAARCMNTPIRDTAKPEFAIASLLRDQVLVLRVPPERLYGLPE